MSDFFDNIPDEQAEQIEALSRLQYELREARNQLLQRHKSASEAELLAAIERGAQGEHPAYEDYLAAQILAQAHQQVRDTLQDFLAEVQRA